MIFNRNDQKCEHFIKYNQRKIEIAAGFGDFNLGKLNIEPTLLQAVTHELMLIDSYQYELCTLIKRLSDKAERDKYYKQMIDDQIRAKRLAQTLMSLSYMPENNHLHETLMNLLVNSEGRAIEIENNGKSLGSLSSGDNISTNALEIEDTSIKRKLINLKEAQPHLEETIKQPGMQLVVTYKINEEFDKIRDSINDLTQKYYEGMYNGLSLPEFWKDLAPVVQKLVLNRANKQLIGGYNAQTLRRYLVNMSVQISEYDKKNAMGVDTSDLEKIAWDTFAQILQRTDDIFFALRT